MLQPTSLFKGAQSVVLSAGGKAYPGRGLISSLRDSSVSKERHPMGTLKSPLSRFVGLICIDEPAEDAVLSACGKSYAVLSFKKIFPSGGSKLYSLLMEERSDSQ